MASPLSAPSPETRQRRGALLAALVFLSGAAALVYEVLWSRQLSTFLGVTSYAQASVVSAYMLGLALGAAALGGLADRMRSPLRLAAVLESGIAVCALAGTWLLPAIGETFAGAEAGVPAIFGSPIARMAAALAVLLLPTFLMGGTLPALVRALGTTASGPARAVGWIYGVNTIGAAAGALLAGYLLLPAFGVRGATWVAVGANLLVAAAFLAMARSRTRGATPPADGHAAASRLSPPPSTPAPTLLSPPARRLVLLLFAVAGFLALAAQMAWVRALTLVIGSSVYAFSVTLAVYLLGLGLGATAAARHFGRRAVARDTREILELLIGLELGIATSVALGLPILRTLPSLFLAGWSAGGGDSFVLLQVVWMGLAAVVMLVPTALSGAMLPVVAALCAGDPSRLGRDTGRVYAANTSGTVLGAPVAALALLPALGVSRTLLALALAHAAVAFALARLARPGHADRPHRRRLRILTAAAAAALVLAVAAGRWDRRLMTSGPYINAFRLAEPPGGRSLGEFLRERDQLLFYREDADGVVTVRDDGTERLLAINGKTDGTRLGDRRTQVAVALLPLLAADDPRRVLVIGLGTGISSGVAAAVPAVERIDVVEISRAVVAASSFFDAENGAVLLDARTRLHLADARGFLQVPGRSWDVIVSEPSNPWIHGVANMFTREAFELAARRLAPGGVVAQWFHVYGMSLQDLRSAIATFRSVFPHATAWIPQTGDLVLLGSAEPVALDLSRFRELAGPSGGQSIGRDRLAPAQLLEDRDLLSMFLLGEDEMARFAAGAPLNTDDRPRLELGAPRHLYRETTLVNLAAMARGLAGREQAVPVAGLLEQDGDAVVALGVRVALEDHETARAEWHVAWTVLESAEAERGVRLLVTQSPTLRLERGDRVLRVRRAPLEEAAGEPLALYAERRLDGPVTNAGAAGAEGSGPLELADGTAATLRATTTGAAALAFDCAAGAGGSRFLALASPDIGAPALAELAARARCEPVASPPARTHR